jgi:hypothetical protein
MIVDGTILKYAIGWDCRWDATIQMPVQKLKMFRNGERLAMMIVH